MTATEILNANEEAYRRRDTISSTLAIGNRGYPDLSILRDITQMLEPQPLSSSKGVWTNHPFP